MLLGRRNFFLKMFRLLTRRMSTTSKETETFMEQMKEHGKTYSIITGLFATAVAGVNFLVGFQIKPLQVEISKMNVNIKELKTQMNVDIKELKNQRNEDMKELRGLLSPLLVEVKVNKELYENMSKRVK
jgi:membrane protein insertase Oxa1/YidC/SpoIIIJ